MEGTLYERLGKSEGISKIVNDALAAHLTNPTVKTRFQNIEDFEHTKKMAFEFFCMGSGGPENYSGKDMAAAHKGMNVSEEEYLAVMDDIMGALENNDVGEQEKKDVLAILYSLKGEIIRG